MHRWTIQFSQMFNGALSQCTVEVDAEDVHGALEEFEGIGYVNARVQAVYRHRHDRRNDRDRRDRRDDRDFREE